MLKGTDCSMQKVLPQARQRHRLKLKTIIFINIRQIGRVYEMWIRVPNSLLDNVDGRAGFSA